MLAIENGMIFTLAIGKYVYRIYYSIILYSMYSLVFTKSQIVYIYVSELILYIDRRQALYKTDQQCFIRS